MKTSKFFKKYEKNKSCEFTGCSYLDFPNYEVEELVKEEIYYRKHKLINKIVKRIAKQIQKNPLQNWYLVDINNYSLKEMKYIKTFFKNQGFKITFEKPIDEMYTYDYSRAIDSASIGKLTITTPEFNSATIAVGSTTTTNDVKMIPRTKFYIVW